MTREQFEELIGKYLSGTASAEERRLIDEFFERQEKTPGSEELNIISEEMWASVIQSTRSSREGDSKAKNEKRVPGLYRMPRMTAAWIFLLLLAFTGLTYLGSEFPEDPARAWVTSASTKGEKSFVTLMDGTKVYLNSASSITYPETFGNDKREIILSGEAFFEVTRDERRPFTVRSANIVTRVLGTSFNVEAFEGEDVTVTVVTGKVEVDVTDADPAANPKPMTLERNEQALYERGSQLEQRTVDVEKFLAWKSNRFYFEDNTMEEVARKLERWYNVTIAFRNEKIKRCRINGQYKDMDLESVLKSVQYMYPLNYEYVNENTIVLYGKGCN